MLESIDVLANSRRDLRRAVSLECEVISDYWDEPVKLSATDLSARGLWLSTSLTLEPGTRVLLSLSPPRSQTTFCVTGQVRHAELRRRKSDGGTPGMGVEFDDISFCERELIDRGLEGLPPHLPREVDLRTSNSEAAWVETVYEPDGEEDASEFSLWIEPLAEPLG